MSRRGDNIHKRKDGRWEGRYKYGFNMEGKTIYKSVYAKTYSDCKSKLEVVKSNNSTKIQAKTSFLFKDVLELWINNNRIRIKGSSLLKYEYLVEKHIAPELGGYHLTQINSILINEFLDKKLKGDSNQLQNSLSPSYVKTMAIIIESAIKFAVSEGLCMPLKLKIYKPVIEKRNLAVLTKEEQNSIEHSLINDGSTVALGIIIALHTGLRIGEICALNWDDIDLSNNLIFVNHTVTRETCEDGVHKTRLVLGTPKTQTSKRVVPISSSLKPILSKYYKEHNYIVSNSHEFIDTRLFDYKFKKILDKNNLESMGFHTLRHTFATRCLQSGMDVKTLSEILGHASASTTLNTYVHPSLEVKRNQLEKVFA